MQVQYLYGQDSYKYKYFFVLRAHDNSEATSLIIQSIGIRTKLCINEAMVPKIVSIVS